MTDGSIQPDVGAVNQPRILFKPGAWLAKIDFINHLVLFNNVLITLLSEKEGGKTSFSTLLQQHVDQQIKPVLLTVKPPFDERHIISDIATQLYLNASSDTHFASIVKQINERKAHVLLIIDDAQNLPESFIREALFSIKNQEDFGFFHLCLISDYSLVATLNQLAVDQYSNLIHTIELGPLNENETRTYVLQRAMNGRLINKPLTEAQFKQFYQLTKGNLAKINSNLESYIQQCLTQKGTNTLKIIKHTFTALAAVAVAGVSYLYLNGFNTDNFLPQKAQLTTTTSIETVVAELKPQPVEVPPQSYIASWQDSSTRQIMHYALPKKQILDDFDDEQELNTVAVVDKVVVIPTVKAREELVETQLPLTQTAAVLESKLVEFKKPEPELIANKTDSQKSGGALYTIQLAASHNISDIHRFRTVNKLLENTRIRHFTNAKGGWYILTLGEYNSRALAQSMTNKLPPKLAKLKPWIRPVAGLTDQG
ncbi:SPOR domain-containing protein [Legionella worsleiensis]|uniref:DamX-related protein n=1 Tax=Legionella worsleiensis TaxID=45076 RepID=A0A0W1A971_9GAMM|nr:SPOR domain-containing protein [Legionella worsleiensis]KTD77835.1 DamX-related protein [Legionella worsleiensis]STY33077.1 DamX-like protein [Legionella worsleiensis]